MPTAYFLAPIPRWTFFAQKGIFAAQGKIYTQRGVDPNQPKAAFRDAGGQIPYDNPIRLDDYGQIGPIYWADDEPYWIQITDKFDNEIATIPNYPIDGGGGGEPINEFIDSYNHLVNPQMYYPYAITNPVGVGPINIVEGGLVFQKSNANCTDEISVLPFPMGQADVGSQPLNYIRHVCTAIGAAGETFKDYIWPLGRVIGFENTQVSVAAMLKSITSSSVQIICRQFFGTGGTPSTTHNEVLLNYAASSTWTQAALTETVPSVSGKTIGDNGDDQLYLVLRMPLNQIFTMEMVNFQWSHGAILPPFEYQRDEFVNYRSIPVPAPLGADANKVLTLDSTGYHKMWAGRAGFPGDMWQTFSPNVVENTGRYTGWLKLESTVRDVSRATYADLFAEIGESYGAGDGSTTFGLPAAAGRALIAACDASTGISERITGELIGEEKHLQSEGEVGGHTHAQNSPTFGSSGSYPSYEQGFGDEGYIVTMKASIIGPRIITDSAGSSTPFNVIQPTAVIGAVLIKF